VRFDRGRVAVTDRAGRTLLDLGGFVGGAVAQIVTRATIPAFGSSRCRPTARRRRRPTFISITATSPSSMATAWRSRCRPSATPSCKISYPDQVSWLTVAERFRSWIIAGLWLFATAALLFILQRMFRRRPAPMSE
jgi:hypothetical protein